MEGLKKQLKHERKEVDKKIDGLVDFQGGLLNV